MSKEIYKKNLYSIIGVTEQASEKEIVKGYRKKALKCHPDKNPDNPKAAELFHELSQALEILTDPAARAAYDKCLKAKKAVEERNQILDSKRKKFKEDLETRERAFKNTEVVSDLEAEKKLKAEIERLRKEGSSLLEKEQQHLKKELKKTNCPENGVADKRPTDSPPRIKFKWKVQKGDKSNGGYNAENLQSILNCYGEISALFVSDKRSGSAIVEFDKVSSDILSEIGHQDNPFTVIWLSGKPCENLFPRKDSCDDSNGDYIGSNSLSKTFGFSSESSAKNGSSANDYENLVLMRMRQAEERKKLIEQMMREDNN
ncbi:DnaJ (Hsp40), sub C, member 17 [Bulinus truncatus]|nr:DnaJ (Hsp40), sub C, member 17 [Bulinus truncatus]